MRALRLSCSILALAPVLASGSVSAQTTSRYPSPTPTAAPYPAPSPYTVQPLSDADQLASEIRLLAADPNNLQALVRAGELAIKLDDDTAAAAFFARAERIDPHNGRVKAGEGSLLVAAERPGEALRRFAEAQSYGADLRGFAADRGLAYDLIGEQDRAQRDYRVALRAGPNEETQRRYALSLGISGKRELALAQIDPLLRKSDRGAWRSRAFILAMNGDKAGAEKIATSMMPSGLSQGLLPFFELLPSLRPADRAFAVHFGEVRATPERLFDARLVPPLAALAPDPTAPVEVAAVTAKPVPVVEGHKERKSRRKRDELAAVTTPPPQPLPAPPEYAGQPVPVPAPVVLASNAVRVPPAYAPVTARVVPTVVATPAPPPAAATVVQRPVPAVPVPAAQPKIVASAPAVVANVKPVATVVPSVPTATVAAPVTIASAQPSPPLAVPTVTAPLPTAEKSVAVPVASVTQPSSTAVPATSVVPSSPPIVAAAVPPPSPTPVRSEESILAAILADIKVPGTELHAEQSQPIVARVTPVVVPVATPPHAVKAAPEPTVDVESAFAAKLVADKKTADKKASIDKKALADKKAAEVKKLADAKKAAEEKRKNDPKILEPSRFWVQVSGGANEHDLPKQWAKVRTQSKAFGGKGGWTTPLRATNRILTGPFKSESEAQSFVNTIAKDGLSGFVFVSDAGQKIAKLGAK